MRKSTLLWLVLAVISGTILFHTSQRVTDGHVRLATLTQNLREEEETIRVLKAEWSYLNQPARLEKLSQQYLMLQPLSGKQMIKPADLPLRPAPVAIAAAQVDGGKAPPPIKAKAPAAVILRKPHPIPHTTEKPRLSERTFDDSNFGRSFGDVMKSLNAVHRGGH